MADFVGRDYLSTSSWLRVVLLASTLFAGATSVMFPLMLRDFGYSKGAIAVFFCVNPLIAVLYNIGLMRVIAKLGYPPVALICTTASVPIGTVLMGVSNGNGVLLYLGSALMVATSTAIPQVIGSMTLAAPRADQDRLVAGLRQIMVAGYIGGLGAYALFEAVNIPAVLGASTLAVVGFIAAIGASIGGRGGRITDAGWRSRDVVAEGSGRPQGSLVQTLVIALVLIALLKSVDTLRNVYLPLYAVARGFDGWQVSLLFGVAAVGEFLLLPVLARRSSTLGEARVLALVCGIGIVSFLILLSGPSALLIVVAQLLYAFLGAGYQSVGIVLLGRIVSGGAGQGAALFQAVIQIGSILGVTLPLLISGYSSEIFLIGALACAVGAAGAAKLFILSCPSREK